MFRRKWPGTAAVAALALLGPLALSACSGGSAGSSSTLTLGVITPATTFKATNMNWENESPYNQAVYDSLLQASPTGIIEPHLATAWSYNAARTVLTMTLRTGVTFTDGTRSTRAERPPAPPPPPCHYGDARRGDGRLPGAAGH